MTTKLTPIEDEMFSYTIDADHAIDNRDLPKALDCIFKGRNTSDEYEARAYFSTGLKEHIGKGC